MAKLRPALVAMTGLDILEDIEAYVEEADLAALKAEPYKIAAPVVRKLWASLQKSKAQRQAVITKATAAFQPQGALVPEPLPAPAPQPLPVPEAPAGGKPALAGADVLTARAVPSGGPRRRRARAAVKAATDRPGRRTTSSSSSSSVSSSSSSSSCRQGSSSDASEKDIADGRGKHRSSPPRARKTPSVTTAVPFWKAPLGQEKKPEHPAVKLEASTPPTREADRGSRREESDKKPRRQAADTKVSTTAAREETRTSPGQRSVQKPERQSVKLDAFTPTPGAEAPSRQASEKTPRRQAVEPEVSAQAAGEKVRAKVSRTTEHKPGRQAVQRGASRSPRPAAARASRGQASEKKPERQGAKRQAANPAARFLQRALLAPSRPVPRPSSPSKSSRREGGSRRPPLLVSTAAADGDNKNDSLSGLRAALAKLGAVSEPVKGSGSPARDGRREVSGMHRDTQHGKPRQEARHGQGSNYRQPKQQPIPAHRRKKRKASHNLGRAQLARREEPRPSNVRSVLLRRDRGAATKIGQRSGMEDSDDDWGSWKAPVEPPVAAADAGAVGAPDGLAAGCPIVS